MIIKCVIYYPHWLSSVFNLLPVCSLPVTIYLYPLKTSYGIILHPLYLYFMHFSNGMKYLTIFYWSILWTPPPLLLSPNFIFYNHYIMWLIGRLSVLPLYTHIGILKTAGFLLCVWLRDTYQSDLDVLCGS